MSERPAYALVTPARDEADHLRQLSECVIRQTVPPAEWIVVDDGSRDGTAELVRGLGTTNAWIRVIPSPSASNSSGSLELGRREGRDVVSFKAGIAALGRDADFVVKLDADVTFEDDFFERLLERFEHDPQLGIASGTCYELQGGEWRQRHVTGDHVWGATRMYRRACFDEVSPIEERLGWDGIDQFKANAHGWTTETMLDLPFRHHRREGQREGTAIRAWAARGGAAHYMGYRPWFLVLRALLHARSEPAALAMIAGWCRSALRRETQCSDTVAVRHLRSQQSLRGLPRRARQALGR